MDVSPIGIHDNFFHLGGHSLLASRFVSRLHEAFHLELPLRSVFELPTVASLAEWVENHRNKPQETRTLPIVARSRGVELPLSFSQEGLWFLNQLEPGSCAYNLSSVFRLTGTLDVPAMEQSFNEIVKRHEALRTVFKSVAGQPLQVVLPSMVIRLAVVDLRALASRADQEAEICRLRNQELLRPFDLAQGPLLRVTLLQLTEDTYILLIVVHHIVFDGWSMGILAREVSALYDDFSNGKSPSLPDLKVQYADFAVWQREKCQGQWLDAQLSYWKHKLKQIPPLLELPTDKPRPSVQTHRGGKHSFVLSKTLSTELKGLSQQHRVTLFMTLLAAYQTLLHRYTGQNDVVIGSPVAGRNLREVECLIGFFLNMLVLRTDLSGNPTFGELLARVREVCLEAYAHQDVPFEKLVEELRPERSLTHNPLFQATFTLQNTPRVPIELDGKIAHDFDTGGAIARFDLHLFMIEEEDGLRGWMNYNTDLFNSETIARMVEHLQVLLEGIVADPDRCISDLPILTAAERHQLLVEWNDTKRDYPQDKCIHQLFEEQVERTPDAVAVVFEDQQLTYHEINARANRLAHYLRKRGVNLETLVAVCMERSAEMVVAILGILKAGGAYVPIEPDSPPDRLKFMLQDSHSSLILTQERFRSFLAGSDVQRVCLDSAWDDLLLESQGNLENQTDDKNAAYMIYTSGSTGTPKGVVNLHGGLGNRLQWMQETYRLSAADRVLQKTPFTFDVSVWEFFWPLISGACLVVARPGGHRDSAYLVSLIQSQQITTLHFVPSMLGVFLQQAGVENCTSLRQVICSGETLSCELPQRFFERTDAALFNLYGPTEASIDVTAWECRRDSERTVVPIGQPIANTQIYILDRQLQPVPIGVAGELHIGGVGLARGYLNRPELTREKFIANPFCDQPGAKLYKTGDLARYLPDGNIEFVGRMDNQVKIRGYRIELGEIEAVLGQHPVVQSAVVLLREDAPGDKRLVGYVVFRKPEACSTSALREFLKQKLPEPMVPAAFVYLDAMPLTANGKTDRRALPKPDRSRSERDDNYVAPRNHVEEILVNLWSEVLKRGKVGSHDNFLELGGNSLLATQLVSRIRDALKIELSLRRLFEAPTVAGLAKYIELSRQPATSLRTLPIVAAAMEGEYPLSFAQERFLFLEQLEPNNLAYHVTYSFRLIGPLNIEALEKTISETVRRHESLRTTFHLRNGQPVQVISDQWSSPLKVIDLTKHCANREAEVQRIFTSERQCAFDLSRDLLLRAALLQLGTDEHVLILNSHHIAWDHWCIEILFREFAALYRAYAAGKPSPLPDLIIQYRHYALWQRQVLDRAELQNHLAYWQEQLRDVPLSLNLPTEQPRKPLRNRRGGRQSVILPKRLTSELELLSRQIRRDLVHGLSGGVPDAAPSANRTGRYCRRDTDCGKGPLRDRGPDWLISEHAGPSYAAFRQSEVR